MLCGDSKYDFRYDCNKIVWRYIKNVYHCFCYCVNIVGSGRINIWFCSFVWKSFVNKCLSIHFTNFMSYNLFYSKCFPTSWIIGSKQSYIQYIYTHTHFTERMTKKDILGNRSQFTEHKIQVWMKIIEWMIGWICRKYEILRVPHNVFPGLLI